MIDEEIDKITMWEHEKAQIKALISNTIDEIVPEKRSTIVNNVITNVDIDDLPKVETTIKNSWSDCIDQIKANKEKILK
jgi:hypothetical protein